MSTRTAAIDTSLRLCWLCR